MARALLAPPHRQRGAGTATEVFLEVRADNPRAHGLYHGGGGSRTLGVRRGYYPAVHGVDAIVMRKDPAAIERADRRATGARPIETSC